MGKSRLDVHTIEGELRAEVDAFRRVLAPGALVWLRCCSAFGNEQGRRFAERLATRLGARVAAHTYIIGVWQSGTHSVAPGEDASWPEEEGLEIVSGVARGARVSAPQEPMTVTCLRGGLPDGW